MPPKACGCETVVRGEPFLEYYLLEVDPLRSPGLGDPLCREHQQVRDLEREPWVERVLSLHVEPGPLVFDPAVAAQRPEQASSIDGFCQRVFQSPEPQAEVASLTCYLVSESFEPGIEVLDTYSREIRPLTASECAHLQSLLGPVPPAN